jgi:hypothetical protein
MLERHSLVALSGPSSVKLVAIPGPSAVIDGRAATFSLIFKGAGDERLFRF